MAKKTLTPEQAEIKAIKKAKSSQNWTKFWAIVLAAALTVGVVFMGKTQADNAIAAAGTVQGDDATPGDTTPDAQTPGTQTPDAQTPDTQTPDTQTPDTQTPDTQTPNTPSGNTNKPSGDTNSSSDAALVNAIKTLNDVTAKAAKGNYHWERESYYTRELDVDGKSFLDGIIKMVDPNASIASVVGGFLDITGEGNLMTADVKNGQLAVGMKDNPKFLMIASKITESDVKSYNVAGNKYTFELKDCNRPEKDGKSTLSKVTNDFITKGEVNDGIKGALSGAGLGSLVSVNDIDVDFKSITVTAEIVDGKLTKYEISYAMDVKSLAIKVAIGTLGGSGAGVMKCWYTNFNY